MTPSAAADLVARAYTAGPPTGDVAGDVDVSAVMSKGEIRRRRQRNASTAILAGSASLVVVLATTTGAALNAPSALFPAAGEAEAADLLSLLDQPPTDVEMRLGEDEDVVDDQSMLPSSVRLISATDGVEYYAGTNTRGDVCLAVGWAEIGYGSGCTSLAEFEAAGLTAGSSGDGAYTPDPANYFTTLLVPDGTSLADGTGLAEVIERADIPADIPIGDIEIITPNLIVIRPPA